MAPSCESEPFQQEVWRIATEAPESRTAALAGSGGLAVHRILLRRPADIDLFVTNAEEVYEIWQDIVPVMIGMGFTVEVLRESRARRHIMVIGLDQATKVDVGVAFRVGLIRKGASCGGGTVGIEVYPGPLAARLGRPWRWWSPSRRTDRVPPPAG